VATLLSINNYYYRRGGAESLFLDQNRMLEQTGWDVVPFAMQHENNLPSPWQHHFVQEIEYGKQVSLLKKIGNAQKIIFSFEARKQIGRLIDQTHPDIAHAHNVYHHLSPSVFSLLKTRGIPTLLTLHDLKIACPAYKMLAADGICERCREGGLWQVAAQRCIKESRALSMLVMLESYTHRLLGCYTKSVDHFLVPSRFYIDKLVEWGWERERFSHVPNFVDLKQFAPSDTAPGTAFLFAGRLAPEKGLQTFIRAAAIANVEAWIAGTGPEENKLRALAIELGANVRFFGYQSGAALHELISAARALVLPSEWYENAPVSILEAYALGRPVIGAGIGGIPELIREGETGALFPSKDAHALAEVLARYSAAANPVLETMGKAGREWVETDFSADRYRQRLLSAYRSLGVEA
jgi:glycosyltransferase involved in cell wall biosynthesis